MRRLLHAGNAQLVRVVRSFDPYVPLAIEFGDSLVERIVGAPSPHLSHVPLYWRVIAPQSLLELGVDAATGVWRRLVLTSHGEQPGALAPFAPTRSQGLPIFDLGSWRLAEGRQDPGAERCDIEGDIQLELGDAALRVRLLNSIGVYGVDTGGGVAAEFDGEGGLAAVVVKGLSPSEALTFRDALVR